jgi:hypothetical protein
MATCPECGTEDLRLTSAGLLYKHGPADAPCPGSGGEPAMDDGGDGTHDSQDQESANDLGYGHAAFDWQLTISQPALYLDDKDWHLANAAAAALAAEQAGHTPLGEGQCTNVAATEDGAGLVLTYTVPVDGGSS